MRSEIIRTKLDGHQLFQWWEKEDFEGRTCKVYTSDTLGNMKLDSIETIADDFIVCDFCNEYINAFPVPVFRGTHALCQKCFKKVVA